MKLAALVLLFAIFGKMSAVPLRVGYYRAAPPQQDLEEEESDEVDEISKEDFTQADQLPEDDDDSDEHETPPQFQKLFPLPQANSPGHNMPLAVMMSEIGAQGWNVPRRPHQIPKNQQGGRARDELDMTAYNDDDDDDEDSDEEEDEEDDEPEDDLPDWQKLFPNSPDQQGNGPPAGVVDQSAAPELPASFRSALPGGSRVVYIPARQLRQQLRRPQAAQIPRQQYIMRAPVSQPRIQYMYVPTASLQQHRPRQPMVARRPQQQQYMLAPAGSSRRSQQQQVYYMPVRRGSYSPYTSAYVPRYRY